MLLKIVFDLKKRPLIIIMTHILRLRNIERVCVWAHCIWAVLCAVCLCMLFVCEKEYAAAWQILGLYALPCFLFSLSLSLSHSVIYCCHNASKTDGNAIFFFEQKNEMKLEYEISITFFNSQNLSNSTHLMLIAIGTCIVCFFWE